MFLTALRQWCFDSDGRITGFDDLTARSYGEHWAMRKWAETSGILGAVWMLVLLWVRSPRLVYITDYPALLLTASLVPLHGSGFIFYFSLVLSSAIQWALIGILFRALRRIRNESQAKLRTRAVHTSLDTAA